MSTSEGKQAIDVNYLSLFTSRTTLLHDYLLPHVGDTVLDRMQVIGGAARSPYEALLLESYFHPKVIDFFEVVRARNLSAQKRWSEMYEGNTQVSFRTASLRRRNSRGNYAISFAYNIYPSLINGEDIMRLITQTRVGGFVFITTWRNGDTQYLSQVLQQEQIKNSVQILHACKPLYDEQGEFIPQTTKMIDRAVTVLRRID